MVGTFDIQVDDTRRFVKVIYQGDINLESATKLVRDARAKAHELSYNLLYDFRAASIQGSIGEMYFFLRKHEALNAIDAGAIRSANLIPKDRDIEDWRFFEITARSKGLKWRSFADEDEALSWLAESED